MQFVLISQWFFANVVIMMKKYIVAFLVLWGSMVIQFCYAQTKTITCIYNAQLNSFTEDENVNKSLRKDKKTYEVTYNQQAYLCKKTYDNTETQLVEDHLEDYIDLKDSIYTSQIFFCNYVDDDIPIKTYLVTGRLKPFQWQITSETKTINGMTCFKATYTEAYFKYYSPQYVAWFTMDVPISVGPMMQTNLPGMIVRLCTPSLVYNLGSFSYSNDASIVKPTKGTPVSEEQYNAYVEAYNAKLNSIAQQK